MAASTGDFRPLLSGGLWLAGIAGMLACCYAILSGLPIFGALGFDYVLIAVATWAVRDLEQKRSLTALKANSPSAVRPGDSYRGVESDDLEQRVQEGRSPSSLGPDIPMGSVRIAVQTQAMALGMAAAIVGFFALLQLMQPSPSGHRVTHDDIALGMVCLASSFVWIVLARSFQSIRKSDLPEAPPLASAFREAQWIALIASVAFIGASLELMVVFWTTRLLLVWIVIICVETLIRSLAIRLIPVDSARVAVSPIHLISRDAIFAAANPVTSLIHTFESHGVISLRSSWAMTFVRQASLPMLIFLLLLCWGLTSLAIVETHQLAVREHFGRIAGEPLLPGLHFMLPWPFGRIRSFPVKTVQELPIGYVETEDVPNPDRTRALLWTKPHAKEEFALVLGNGSELVAVNALVYFKISQDRQEFLDYVYQQSTPEESLNAFAYRALMEQTRGQTLDDILSANRAAFAHCVVESVRQQVKAARLGLEVVDFALLNLHPPIEAGGSYLEVINARLDARRRVTEAEGGREVALFDAETRGSTMIASAQVHGSRRVAEALGEVAEFKSIGNAQEASSQTLRLRLWIESLEQALSNQRLFLVDKTLLDEGGELMLDTRPLEGRRSPMLDAPSPFTLPGANHDD